MDKYVHIEDLKNYLNRQIQAFEPCPDKYDAAVGIYDGIYKIPAADVVPVVRCKECRHWHRCISTDDRSVEYFNFSYCEKGHNGFPKFFCADGARMDSDEV